MKSRLCSWNNTEANRRREGAWQTSSRWAEVASCHTCLCGPRMCDTWWSGLVDVKGRHRRWIISPTASTNNAKKEDKKERRGRRLRLPEKPDGFLQLPLLLPQPRPRALVTIDLQHDHRLGWKLPLMRRVCSCGEHNQPRCSTMSEWVLVATAGTLGSSRLAVVWNSGVPGGHKGILSSWIGRTLQCPYYPEQSTDLMQSLSKYPWHFPQNWKKQF